MLYVSIGRNVGDVPMSDRDWDAFGVMVEDCICHAEELANADTLAEGRSRYGDMAEDTRVLVWFDKMSALKPTTVARLSAIATVFGQECIAWSVSETNFTGGV